ncbi:hypothetical protein LTR05_000301 [Lithohypha guttulata]|uniref:Geranylgeranyl pyrophosphate synthetase n=1 Tax=Lithohypha guttulata TaxID=1690604 RepID=A0AAN7Y992_9EURO|nr:hypothetical protein LTR05_000301 [Lithohypha guttulata]
MAHVVPGPRKIHSISSAEIPSIVENGKPSVITGVEVLTSFNWLNAESPTILIPGCPPKYTEPSRDTELRRDEGSKVNDASSEHYSAYPPEPAVRALLHTRPSYSDVEVDIFGCGNTFTSLLYFVSDIERDFRFSVQRIGKTLFLVRQTFVTDIDFGVSRGYNRAFAKAYTIWEGDAKNSNSHQRVLRYDLAGFKCVVRGECDAYLPDKLHEFQSRQPACEASEKHEEKTEAGCSSTAAQEKVLTSTASLTLLSGGCDIPHDALVSIETRASYNQRDPARGYQLPRLWLRRTPNLMTAIHVFGIFEKHNRSIRNVKAGVKAWETENTETISKLRNILQKLVEISSIDDQDRIEVRRRSSGPLEIWSARPGWSALPEELRARWTDAMSEDTVRPSMNDGAM